MIFQTLDYNYQERFSNMDIAPENIINSIIDNYIKNNGNITKHAFIMHGGQVTVTNRRRDKDVISYYYDMATMKNVIHKIINLKELRIKLSNLLLSYDKLQDEVIVVFKKNIGIVFVGEEEGKDTNKAKIIIRKDERNPFRLFTPTTYPVL